MKDGMRIVRSKPDHMCRRLTVPGFGKMRGMKDKRLLQDLGCILTLGLLYLALGLIGVGCPIKFHTGVSCLGCGMTRAWISVLRLRFGDAFSYHPLWPVPLIWLIMFSCKKRLDRFNVWLFKAVDITFIAAFVIVYIMRMADPSDTIVVFEPENGFIYKAAHFVMLQFEAIFQS